MLHANPADRARPAVDILLSALPKALIRRGGEVPLIEPVARSLTGPGGIDRRISTGKIDRQTDEQVPDGGLPDAVAEVRSLTKE